jgi:hypothetical protein
MIGDPARPFGEFGERQFGLAPALIDDPQTRTIIALRHRVKIIERPVERVQDRPAEIAISRLVILAVGKQEIPRLNEGRRRHTGSSQKFA